MLKIYLYELNVHKRREDNFASDNREEVFTNG